MECKEARFFLDCIGNCDPWVGDIQRQSERIVDSFYLMKLVRRTCGSCPSHHIMKNTIYFMTTLCSKFHIIPRVRVLEKTG